MKGVESKSIYMVKILLKFLGKCT